MTIRYCSQCGSDHIRFYIPEGDHRPRHVCEACGFIHYQNPNIVAGCLITHNDKILFCRRGIKPRYGRWTLPAGFMENGETSEQAALRETWEEACARVRLHGLYTLLNTAHINQVYMMYRGELITNPDGEDFAPTPESTEVVLLGVDEIPWDELAFPTIRETLKLYVQDIQRGHFPFHSADIVRPWVVTNPMNAYLRNLVSQ